jgi:DtxR family Mn-dependent transcriptional regulator
MSDHNLELSAANIKYLLVLGELEKSGSGVRCVDVAKRLGVTKPSVYTMINTLCSLKLVSKERYGTVHLTDIGREKMVLYTDCFQILFKKLEGSLELNMEDCFNAACAVLARTPEAELATLRQKLCAKGDEASR